MDSISTPPPSQAPTIRPAELAKRLQVRHGKVYQWIEKGELAAINLATDADARPRWRISEQAVADFLSARTSGKPTPTAMPPRRRVVRKPLKQYV